MEKSPLDLYRWDSSRDLGLLLQGALGKEKRLRGLGGEGLARVAAPNLEVTRYDEAADGTRPGADVVPRVTLFFSW